MTVALMRVAFRRAAGFWEAEREVIESGLQRRAGDARSGWGACGEATHPIPAQQKPPMARSRMTTPRNDLRCERLVWLLAGRRAAMRANPR